MKLKIVLIPGLLFTLSGCAQNAAQQQTTQCPTERPAMCTMDYTPVCGNSIEGQQQTYSNGCSACANETVTSYTQGECKN